MKLLLLLVPIAVSGHILAGCPDRSIPEEYYQVSLKNEKPSPKPLIGIQELKSRIERYSKFHKSVNGAYFMDMLNTRENTIYLLESLISDNTLLSEAAERSRGHSLDFTKIVLLRNRDEKAPYELRLHLWSPTKPDPFDEGIHNHFSKNIVSYVISGELEHFVYPDYVHASDTDKTLYKKALTKLLEIKDRNRIRDILYSLMAVHQGGVLHPLQRAMLSDQNAGIKILSKSELARVLCMGERDILRLSSLHTLNEVYSRKRVEKGRKTTRIFFEPRVLVSFQKPMFDLAKEGTTFFIDGRSVYLKVIARPSRPLGTLQIHSGFIQDASVFNRMDRVAEEIKMEKTKEKLSYMNKDELKKVLTDYLSFLKR